MEVRNDMFTRKRKIYIVVCVIFLTLLVLSDTIIANIVGNNFVRISNDIEKYQKDDVCYSFRDVKSRGDVFHSADFVGWAFCETESDNSNKEISIILLNDKRTYVYKVSPTKRVDVVRAYRKDRKIKGKHHGISTTVSTVGVKNGIYKVYIFCKENEKNYGLVYTGKMIKKDSRGINPYVWVSSKCKISEAQVEKNIKYKIDSISSTNDDNMRINGWSFIEGVDTDNQLVYVRLTYENGETAIYNTEGYLREDVGRAYKSNLYNNSGFKAVIPTSEIGEGDIKIEVLVEKNGIVYLSPKSNSYLSEDGVKYEKKGENATKELANNISNADNISNIDTEKIEESSDIRYHIDSFTVKSDISINAWAFIKDIESSQTKIYIAITSADGSTRLYTTNKRSRADVAKAYKNEIYTESGFTASIPIDAISEGENTITIIADNGQQLLRAVKSYIYEYKADDNK